MANNPVSPSVERIVRVQNGWVMLGLLLAALVANFAFLVLDPEHGTMWLIAWLVPLAIFVLLGGCFSLQPNEARVLVLFGQYKGTVRDSGFHWGNPFYTNGPQQWTFGQAAQVMSQTKASAKSTEPHGTKRALGRNKISLRARTLNGERLKVNDKRGNPIEIAAVVVWRI